MSTLWLWEFLSDSGCAAAKIEIQVKTLLSEIARGVDSNFFYQLPRLERIGGTVLSRA